MGTVSLAGITPQTACQDRKLPLDDNPLTELTRWVRIESDDCHQCPNKQETS